MFAGHTYNVPSASTFDLTALVSHAFPVNWNAGAPLAISDFPMVLDTGLLGTINEIFG